MHPKARDEIREFSKPVKLDIGELLYKLQLGVNIGLPDARPMPDIHKGAYELRVKDRDGIYRVFYYLKSEHGIFVFHAFTKKTQKTPQAEIETGRRRLLEML
ncbi:MAG: type II toxin-antitoxin system RelE/ParE family toxin [Pyrinomonadaceae bacterium]